MVWQKYRFESDRDLQLGAFMRKYETKKITKEILIETDVICNKCGKEFSFEHEEMLAQEVLHISYEGGYGSKYPGDMVAISFDLCDLCIKEFAETFQHPPEIDNSYWEDIY